MFSGPLFRREYLAATRRRRPVVFRTVFAVVLGSLALVAGYFLFERQSDPTSPSPPQQVVRFGQVVFLGTVGIEVLFLIFIVPASVSEAIAEERQQDTLSQLLLTRLRPVEIVLVKMMARWVPAAYLILTGLPVLVAAAWMAGLERCLVPTLVVLAASSGFMAAMAILASSRAEQPGAARGQALAGIMAWLAVPPFVTIIPVPTGTLWGDLMAELKNLCVFIAPSSPISLVTDRAWYFRPQAVRLEDRVAWMVGLQALFGLLAVSLAASRLRARERNPNWLDPTRGYRTPCGDDPIYWREFEFPMRRGGGSLVAIRLRHVWILIQATLLNLLTLVGTLLFLAVPLGLLASTFHYGSAAFGEVWQHGYGPAGPFDERERFNFVIRGGTGLLVFLPALGLPALIVGRITAERDRKTWDAFLTTPLTDQEILRSKSRAALHGLWQAAKWVPLLWVLGLATGSVMPLGVALAGIDLALCVWAAVALGLWLGIQPGLTSTASSRAALSLIGFFTLHAPALWAALVSPREWAEFALWPAPIRWGLILAGLAVPVVTAAIAWWLTQRTIRRFDEWVGRPCRSQTVRPRGVEPTPVGIRPQPA